jgi:5'-methylthioadenosine phosphorylase
MMNDQPVLGILGGTGLYSMPDLENVEEQYLETPFGQPSGPIIKGLLNGKRVAFLARHGKGHSISPSEINFRANFYALKMLGITRVLSINAVGSLREDFAPGDIVIPDQVFDFTKDRKRTFFSDGLVAHISVADPFCEQLSEYAYLSAKNTGVIVHRGGTFITVEGPRFSTKAESKVFREWGMSIIGMNTAPEAFLAREAEMCFAIMAHVTDYDVWHISEIPVTVEIVIKRILENIEISKQSVRNLVSIIEPKFTCNCQNALENSFVTDPATIPAITRDKLDLLVRKYIK